MERTPPKILSASDSNLNVSKRANVKRLRLQDEPEPDVFVHLKEEILQVLTNTLNPILGRLQNVEKKLSDIKEQNCEIKSTSNEIEKSLAFISTQIQDFEKKIDNLEKDLVNTNNRIIDLEEKKETLDRIIRKTSVEIRGVPKKKKENKLNILNRVACLLKTLNLHDASTEIKDVYRLPSKEASTTSTIVVEFSNVFLKDKFLKYTKRYNNENKTSQLNTTHLDFDTVATPIYFSDHLTSKAKRLHFLARDFAQSEKYQFCWIANGRIFLRKEEGAKYIHVKNENTLQLIRKNHNSVN